MKLFTDTLIDELTDKAHASPRRRAHHNIHLSPTDPVQRFFVVADRDSYFRPHRHLTKSELAIVLRGGFEVVTFDETGRVLDRYAVGEGSGNIAYEATVGTWHTLLALTDGCAFFEVKEGPYDPATAVDFAQWAPAEGDTGVARFQQWLRTAQVGTIYEA
jgi:cupin fold WbuC family metalloprotein